MRETVRWLLPLLLVGALGVGVAFAGVSMHSAGGTVRTVHSARYGPVLVTGLGRTLYRYTADRKRVSTCHGVCARFWPPLLVPAGTKPTAGVGVHQG
jgi:predicted lipoprotein with Yx(FWY)xxD motif